MDKGARVTLCTSPRRFGKTLNRTMLKRFFEDTAPLAGGKDMRALFRGFNTVGKIPSHKGSATCLKNWPMATGLYYVADWKKEGYDKIIKYDIGFYRKRCDIRKGE